eukprot:121927-Pelagomonas_calceolata.AAC.5
MAAGNPHQILWNSCCRWKCISHMISGIAGDPLNPGNRDGELCIDVLHDSYASISFDHIAGCPRKKENKERYTLAVRPRALRKEPPIDTHRGCHARSASVTSCCFEEAYHSDIKPYVLKNKAQCSIPAILTSNRITNPDDQ